MDRDELKLRIEEARERLHQIKNRVRRASSPSGDPPIYGAG
ncbi:hypothetical protein [Paenibacillus polysaccharolyticus]